MSTPGLRLHDFVLGTNSRRSRMLGLDDSSLGGFMKFQAARQWIPQAGIARRLNISPRAIRRLVACGDLTVRLIPGCQARGLANEVNRLVAQNGRPESARD
jgi:hypothetical protein